LQLRGGQLQKSRLARDSLVPPTVDFGYAGARQSVRVRAFYEKTGLLCPQALERETTPRAVSAKARG
jgi:hypothetical protein